MPDTLLKNRDYTVIVAKTATNNPQALPGFEHRWSSAEAAIMTLVEKCQEFDPDGVTIYISSQEQAPIPFKKYEQVTAGKLGAIFQENYPPEILNLLEVLKIALDDFLNRKASGQMKQNGEIILVVVDGEPGDRMALVRAIVQATQQIERDEELGIGFVQIGNNLLAKGFLQALDENLHSAGAKFDVVHTKELEDIPPTCLTEFLLDIIRD